MQTLEVFLNIKLLEINVESMNNQSLFFFYIKQAVTKKHLVRANIRN